MQETAADLFFEVEEAREEDNQAPGQNGSTLQPYRYAFGTCHLPWHVLLRLEKAGATTRRGCPGGCVDMADGHKQP